MESSKCSTETIYPLSYMQEGMLFHELRAPGSGINTEQIICHLHEAIDVTALKRAWKRVVERHAIFRTSFHWVGYSRPVQKVIRDVDINWEFKDWRKFSREVQNSMFHEFLEADCRCGFNISKAPVARWILFRVKDEEYRLLWSFNHMLMDARSFTIVLIEVFILYEAFKQGLDIEIRIPRPYEDYIQWLRDLNLKDAEAFWRDQLKGFTSPTPLCPKGCDIGRNGDGIICAETEAHLSSETTQNLKDLAARNHFTLNTIVQGAWAILLSRYSREKDVVFGAVRACRRSSFEEAKSIVGVLINTLPIRVQVPADMPFIPWLKELRSQYVHLRDFEHSPLVEVQKWSDLPPATPLFESIIVFDNLDLNAKLYPKIGNSGMRYFQLTEKTKYPITLYGYSGETLKLKIGYQEARCDESTANRLLDHLKNLLESIAACPNQGLGTLPILTADDQKQFIEWNNTHKPFPENVTINQLFEAQAERTPESVALIFEDQCLTYRELNIRANQLANHLRRIGVGPEVLVGICVDRSLEMVIGLLGILKAGGAYVPLDPTYPPERLGFMVLDAQASVIVTQESLLKLLPDVGSKFVILDRDCGNLLKEPGDNPLSGVKAENLAYVIYTSGSTGKPKGVMVEHGNVVNFFTGMDFCIEHDPGDTWLAVTSPSFDISVLEIFWTLARGFRVVIYSGKEKKESKINTYSIPELIKRYNVSHFQCTPSMASMLMLDKDVKSAFRGLKKLLIGGEAFPYSLSLQLQKIVTGDIINMYGPTETTVWSTSYKLNNGLKDIPIGRPIANTQIHIIDENMRQVPVGVPGELMIGGLGVVRGYLNRPELTEEKFIRHPNSGNKRKRLYRTGDLARYLPDGNIEFMGRMDHQVKLLGYRIELDEIEAVLNEHLAVYESVVTVREDVPGRKKIVAYVIPREGESFSPSELRSYTKEKLPGYMVPAYVVALKTFPKTPNKKIDRKALPPPDNGHIERGTSFEPPCTDIEEAVAQIWSEVLGIQEVGRNDNFFDLGGDSLSACGTILNIQQTCNIDLPLQTIFHAPTVETLSNKLEEAFQKQADTENTNKDSRAAIQQSIFNRIDVKTVLPNEQNHPNLEAHFELPRTSTEKMLATIWTKTLRINRVSRNDNFFHLGCKSLDAVSLFTEIEKEFGKRLPLSTLLHAPTIAQLANMLHEEVRQPNWSPLVPIQPTGSRPPLFFVHAHRGNVLNYYPIAHYLGPEQPFYGIQARGLDGQETGFLTFTDMANDYLSEIRTVQPRGPYFLGGYCLGGYIALEMAHLIKEAGEKVALLLLIDTSHPDYPVFLPSTTIFHRITYKFFEKIEYELSAIRAINKKEIRSHIWRKAKALLSRIQVSAELLIEPPLSKFHLKAPHSMVYKLHRLYRMHNKAYKAYSPRSYYGRIALFRSSKQPRGIYTDPTLGWKDILKGELDQQEIPGHYIDLFVEPSVRILSDKLKKCLNSTWIEPKT